MDLIQLIAALILVIAFVVVAFSALGFWGVLIWLFFMGIFAILGGGGNGK